MALLLKNQLNEETEQLITATIGAALEVHRGLGPGYMEKVYENALGVELKMRGIEYEQQVPVAVMYKGVKIR